MAQTQVGLPGAAAITGVLDGLGGWFKRLPTPHGLGLASESGAGTIAYYAQVAATKVLGDGTSSNPGIDNAHLQEQMRKPLSDLTLNSRYDVLAAMQARTMINTLDQFVLVRAPAGWSLYGGSVHALSALLMRLNATNSSAPATPTDTPTAAATTGGSLPEMAAGSAPRIKVTFVGAYDWLESQPSAASTQVAIVAPNSAYKLGGLTGNVPTGVTKLRVYRQLAGAGVGDPYYWDQDVAVTAGTAWSVYMSGGASETVIRQADIGLRQDVQPPSWLQAMALPEEAALFALAYASLGQSEGAQNNGLTYQASGMLDPSCVVLGPASGFLGTGNPASSGQFGALVLGTGYTAGAIRTSNDATLVPGAQGFAGASALQARVTATLSGGSAATITDVTYTYHDAAHPPSGAAQTATVSGLSISISDAISSVADLGITAGRLVRTVTSLTIAGRTTGTVIVEAKDHRSI